jgi:hypothetical protein
MPIRKPGQFGAYQYWIPQERFTPPSEGELVDDWRTLRVGDQVIILDVNHLPVSGQVEDMDPQLTVIWIDQDHNRGRRMFARTDARSLWRVPEQPRQHRSSKSKTARSAFHTSR